MEGTLDSQIELGHFFEKLSIQKEESHKDVSYILTLHTGRITKGINNLVQEVSDLKVGLSIIRKERNYLLQTVHNLSNDNRHRSAYLSCPKSLQNPVEIYANDIHEAINPSSEIEENNEQNIEISNIHSETCDPTDTGFNESADLDNVEHVKDEEVANEKVNEENHKKEETVEGNGRTKRREMHLDSTASKSWQYASKFSKSTVQEDVHICPECNFAFSTSENLGVHL